MSLPYFIVDIKDVRKFTDVDGYMEFIAWCEHYTSCVRLPWDDYACSLESYVVDDEDFENQDEVFTDCNLNIQNLIYKLKKEQLKEVPGSKAELVFKY